MTSYYNILKAAKIGAGAAADYYSALMLMNMKIKKMTGVPPLSFRTNGEPLVDWEIFGNMVQEDTPSYDNWVEPEVCGNATELYDVSVKINDVVTRYRVAKNYVLRVTSTGKGGWFLNNKLITTTNQVLSTIVGNADFEWRSGDYGDLDGTVTEFLSERRAGEDGRILLTYFTHMHMKPKFGFKVSHLGISRLRLAPSESVPTAQYLYENGQHSEATKVSSSTFSLIYNTTLASEAAKSEIYYVIGYCIYTADSGETVTLISDITMSGATYAPGYIKTPAIRNVPVTVNGVTTDIYIRRPLRKIGNYADVISADGTMTSKISEYIFTGAENIHFLSNDEGEYGTWQFYADNIVNGAASTSCASSITPYGATADNRGDHEFGCYTINNGNGIAFQMAGAKETFTDAAAFKAYLAHQYAYGTPVIIWFVLAQPETEQVTVPEIQTVKGDNTFDVGTDLSPSDVCIRYKV